MVVRLRHGSSACRVPPTHLICIAALAIITAALILHPLAIILPYSVLSRTPLATFHPHPVTHAFRPPPPPQELDIKTYARLVCTLLDIPVYDDPVESLHVLFTLYLEFKNNPIFRCGVGGNSGPTP